MVRTLSLWSAGVVSLVLALELLCRLLPVSTSTETGYYTDPLILTYPSRHRWVASTGWDLRNAQTLRANNLGYPADRDFVRDERAVALIGDSFVEASMLPAADRPGAQLAQMLGTRPVYAMGAPGTALLDYAERIRYAHEKLGVRDFVVLMERGDVKQSLCGSGNVHGPCLDPKTLAPRIATLPPPGTAKRWLRHSALAQYLASQLRVTPQALLDQLKPKWLQAPHATAQPVAVPADTAVLTDSAKHEIDTVVTTFFERIKPHVQGKLVVVLDSDRVAMYTGQLKPDPARQRFINLARGVGALVVDTEPIFATHLAQSPLRLDVGPYDGHLNALGVELVARSASAELIKP
ncbi:MAG: hypothetical protein PHQ58_13880 [Rhodoferax sp.]|uniref:hypothetical protein n=1 Tax=Rhodoferax sp. TaxID=50421 RepID=UPI0026322134|nr:hypothetical protein [Rhodoferax sp.]MDD2881515.1 hypothetical protein [Rhodoferax sp.]